MKKVELKSFITEGKYKELINYFESNGKLIKESNKETFFFNDDLRIEKDIISSKIALKKSKYGNIEIAVDVKDFDRTRHLFEALGFNVKLKWLRKRLMFEWKGVNVALDDIKGYGFIIVFQKDYTSEDRDDALRMINMRMMELGIPTMPKSKFEKRFEEYKKNWRERISS